MNQIEHLQSMIDANSEDWDTRLVLADAMEDADDQVGAFGQRWQVENEKRPEPSGLGNYFWFETGGSNGVLAACAIGQQLSEGPDGDYSSGPHGEHPSRQAAERALAERLWELKEAGELEEVTA